MPVAYEADVLVSNVAFVILVYGQRLFCNIAATPPLASIAMLPSHPL